MAWTGAATRRRTGWSTSSAGSSASALKAQRNFTDPESRIMLSEGGFIACCNSQIAVDAAHQIIVAQRLATNPVDFAGLIPLVNQARSTLGGKLRKALGDTGFATEANLDAIAERRVGAYLSPGRIRHGRTDRTAGPVLKRKPRMQAMAETIRRSRAPKSTPAAQAGRRAGVRSNKAGQRLSTVPAARLGQGQRQMGDGLHRSQPPQAASSSSVRTMHSPSPIRSPTKNDRVADRCRTGS